MKFLLSCTSSQQDQKALIKYYRLELQPAYSDDFVQFLLRFAPHLTFLHSKLVLHSLESLFTRVNLHLFSYLVFYLQLIGSEGAYYRLEVQLAYLVHFAQFLLRFPPHLTFLHSKLILHSLEKFFTRVRLHLYFLFGLLPLDGRIL